MELLKQLRDRLLADRRITSHEISELRNYLRSQETLELDVVKLLVELLVEARSVCSEFDDLLFDTLKEVLLRDGQIGPDEQYYLLKMLYGDGRLRPSEKAFLRELKAGLHQTTPELDQLFATALSAPAQNWSLG